MVRIKGGRRGAAFQEDEVDLTAADLNLARIEGGCALLLRLLNPMPVDPAARSGHEAQRGAADCLALSQRGKLQLSQTAIKR